MFNSRVVLMVLGMGCATAVPAAAQDRFEAGNQGYIGGYSTFGGYYDTFGGYGGQYSYGYRRYNGSYSSTATVLSVPLVGLSDTTDTCSWLRKKAHDTGSKKWRARYIACFKGQ